jgi:3-dehydroquinate synthase
MKTINVDLAENSYPVYLGQNLLSNPETWQKHLGAGKVLVVSNDRVAPIYMEALDKGLAGKAYETHIVPDGEAFKTVETWSGIIDHLVVMQARRDASLVALGGGVVGDVTGFAAASYMRGVRFLQAPTTLLAQVDASVGGKTGVNHVKGKNLIGAFHQPAAVVIDTLTLSTLPAREFGAGMAEVVKYGAINDPEFLDWLESNRDRINARENEALDYLIKKSVLNKADIVRQDEKEAGIRALLNFGHSFGHALEAETAYERFLHGEAVAIGMVVAARLSEIRGLCAKGAAERLAALLQAFDLPVSIPGDISLDGLAAALQLDKKALARGLRLILITALGQAMVDESSSPGEIARTLEQSMA